MDTVKRYIRAKGESDEIWNSAVLSYAAISGSGRVLTYLVQERGVDVNAIYNGHTLFEWAIEAGYEREPWLRHLAPRYVYPENPQMAICVALLHNLNRSFSSKYALYMLLNEKDPSSDIADLLKSSYGMRIL
ncbi:MAG: hypothetical protein KJ579_03185, partial [Verrucomicrobia bacterium]|nr:hypothetical protein [Verrucomicrobiota bacterium]